LEDIIGVVMEALQVDEAVDDVIEILGFKGIEIRKK